MHKWPAMCLTLAVLAAGAGALYHFSSSAGGGDRVAAAKDLLQGAQRRSALDQCREAAQMVYDVHWAAACLTVVGQSSPGTADGHAECDLPDEKAAVVNAWLDRAEAQCAAEVRAGLDP
jgi:hypothetical protein